MNSRLVVLAALFAAGCSAAVPTGPVPTDPLPTTLPSTPIPTPVVDGMVLIPANSGVKAFRLDAYPVTTQQFVDWANRSVDGLVNARGGDPRRWDGPIHPIERDAVRDATGREIFTTDDSDDDSRILRRDGRFAVEQGFADHPVTEVWWWGAVQYCDARGARLLTEAEWEAAVRGTEGRPWPWGSAPLDRTRAQYGESYGETSPVTAHPAGASPEGVYDLIGNLYTWTSSLDRPYPYVADDGREDRSSLQARITRGGAHDESSLSVIDRDGYSRDPFAGHHHIGFRCAAGV
ncbi:formylglycine-generating enzyme family protein [Lentzea sp. NPDC051213]|uniref:formylglycine-generating enzyme family protein n=1 Tax=Lentzea sp. NPDC051213 TaxID=3364126 RepID=UPI0037BA462E